MCLSALMLIKIRPLPMSSVRLRYASELVESRTRLQNGVYSILDQDQLKRLDSIPSLSCEHTFSAKKLVLNTQHKLYHITSANIMSGQGSQLHNNRTKSTYTLASPSTTNLNHSIHEGPTIFSGFVYCLPFPLTTTPV